MDGIEQLTQSLFEKSNIEECSLHELQSLTRQYPYFAIGHLLLAEKIKTLDDSLYNHQIEKASLYFYNPLWLDYILNKEKYRETEISSVQDDETGHYEPEKNETAVPSPEKTSDDQSTPFQIPGLKIVASPGADNDLLFEPYHTVDYFASQGIKAEQDEKPKDRFGQQLKSFTEWLKAIKRLPEKEMLQKMQTGAEHKVETLAEHSITDRDVVTETMAEVWIKQGNNQKAMEVYNKLSLLYPSKSRYFAAKIEQLKNN